MLNHITDIIWAVFKNKNNIFLIYKITVNPQMKIGWKCPHSQAIQDVDEFVSLSDLEKWITCSPMDPLQWMGAVRTSQ